jgi:hypothetical protein
VLDGHATERPSAFFDQRNEGNPGDTRLSRDGRDDKYREKQGLIAVLLDGLPPRPRHGEPFRAGS